MKKHTVDFCNGPLLKGIVSFTVPIILTSVLQLLFNAADMVVLGQFCGTNAVGAVGATAVVSSLLVCLFIGLSIGTGISTAYALGANDEKQVNRIVHTAIPLAGIMGVLITAVGVAFSPALLRLLATPDELFDQAVLYCRVFFSGAVFNLIYNFGASIIRASGDTRQPLYYLSIAGVLNVLLNLFFVLVLHMDVAGVALATIISQAVSAILVLRNLLKRYDACRLTLRDMHIEKEPLKRILSIGLPSGAQSMAFTISNMLIQSSINAFGSAAVAGHAAGCNIDAFLYVALNSFMQTSMNYTAQNMGAGNFSRIKKSVWLSMACVAVMGIVSCQLVYAFRRPLLSMYLTDSEEAIRVGELRLLYVGSVYFLAGLMDVLSGGLRGIGHPMFATVITLIGACLLRVVWILTVFQLPEFHTMDGLLIFYPITWILTGGVNLIAFLILLNKKKKQALKA